MGAEIPASHHQTPGEEEGKGFPPRVREIKSRLEGICVKDNGPGGEKKKGTFRSRSSNHQKKREGVLSIFANHFSEEKKKRKSSALTTNTLL